MEPRRVKRRPGCVRRSLRMVACGALADNVDPDRLTVVGSIGDLSLFGMSQGFPSLSPGGGGGGVGVGVGGGGGDARSGPRDLEGSQSIALHAAALDLGPKFRQDIRYARLLVKEFRPGTGAVGRAEARAYLGLLGGDPDHVFFRLLRTPMSRETEPPLATLVGAFSGRAVPAAGAAGPLGPGDSSFLCFRWEGLATLASVTDEVARRPDPERAYDPDEARDAAYDAERRQREVDADLRRMTRGVLSLLNPFERAPPPSASSSSSSLAPRRERTNVDRRRAYLAAVMRRSLEALGWMHTRGYVHQTLGAGALLVTHLPDDRYEGPARDVRVKLQNLGFCCRADDAGQLRQQTRADAADAGYAGDAGVAEWARREDLFQLGGAFVDLLFPGVAARGVDLRKLCVTVFAGDAMALRDYVVAEAGTEGAVAFLDGDPGDEAVRFRGWWILSDALTRAGEMGGAADLALDPFFDAYPPAPDTRAGGAYGLL